MIAPRRLIVIAAAALVATGCSVSKAVPPPPPEYCQDLADFHTRATAYRDAVREAATSSALEERDQELIRTAIPLSTGGRKLYLSLPDGLAEEVIAVSDAISRSANRLTFSTEEALAPMNEPDTSAAFAALDEQVDRRCGGR